MEPGFWSRTTEMYRSQAMQQANPNRSRFWHALELEQSPALMCTGGLPQAWAQDSQPLSKRAGVCLQYITPNGALSLGLSLLEAGLDLLAAQQQTAASSCTWQQHRLGGQ